MTPENRELQKSRGLSKPRNRLEHNLQKLGSKEITRQTPNRNRSPSHHDGNLITKAERNKTRLRIGIPQVPGVLTLILGIAALIGSIAITSTILALVGLGLTFWGAVLLYVRSEDYTLTEILDASVVPSTETLGQTIRAFGYEGNPVYLPPKYFESLEQTKIFIPKQNGGSYPTPEQTQTGDQPIIAEPAGLLLTPPGADLVKLFERTLGTSFTRVNLDYLKKHLPTLLIEDLEIATEVELENKPSETSQSSTANSGPSQDYADTDTVQLRMTVTAYRNSLMRDAQQPNGLGSPLTSAIACAIAKATGKLTTITKQETTRDGRKITVEFHLEETEPSST